MTKNRTRLHVPMPSYPVSYKAIPPMNHIIFTAVFLNVNYNIRTPRLFLAQDTPEENPGKTSEEYKQKDNRRSGAVDADTE